jgi:hypothetical protein
MGWLVAVLVALQRLPQQSLVEEDCHPDPYLQRRLVVVRKRISLTSNQESQLMCPEPQMVRP